MAKIDFPKQALFIAEVLNICLHKQTGPTPQGYWSSATNGYQGRFYPCEFETSDDPKEYIPYIFSEEKKAYLLTTQDGQVLSFTLSADGETITWDDADVWKREAGPPDVAGQESSKSKRGMKK